MDILEVWYWGVFVLFILAILGIILGVKIPVFVIFFVVSALIIIYIGFDLANALPNKWSWMRG